MTRANCVWCGVEYNRKRIDNRTCSAACRTKLNNKEHNVRVVPQTISCVVCSEDFIQIRSDSKYCSEACKSKYRLDRSNARYVPKNQRRSKPICRECQKTFEAIRSDAVFCDHACLYRYRYRNNRAELIAKVRIWQQNNTGSVRVYKLNNKIKRSGTQGSISSAEWLKVLKRQNNSCYYCDRNDLKLHIEHVVPLSRGGNNQLGNIVGACPPCNLSKGSMLISEWKYSGLKTAALGYRRDCYPTNSNKEVMPYER